jgi:hydroxypyruvate isomerase
MNRRKFAALMAGALAAPRLSLAAPSSAGQVKFSFMLWALEKAAPFDRCLEMVAEAGYQGIELTGQFQKWSAADRTRILAAMRRHNLLVDSMSGVKAGFAVPAETELFNSQFADHLRFAKELECPQVILLSGMRVEGMTASVQRNAAVETLKRAADAAAKAQIEIVIEPIDYLERPNTFLATVTDGFEIAQTVNAPNLKVLYDFYHEQRSFGNLTEKLEKNIARVGLIHVADVPGRHDPGTGEIDYTSIYRKLAELKYDRWIAMEYYPVGEPVASLKLARTNAQAALAGSH